MEPICEDLERGVSMDVSTPKFNPYYLIKAAKKALDRRPGCTFICSLTPSVTSDTPEEPPPEQKGSKSA